MPSAKSPAIIATSAAESGRASVSEKVSPCALRHGGETLFGFPASRPTLILQALLKIITPLHRTGFLIMLSLSAAAALAFHAPARTITFDSPAPTTHVQRMLLPPRSIRVWLPPGYEQSQRHYPTLYVHDGQCCLSAEGDSGGGGEESRWGIDSALSRLVTNAEIAEPIVVMIDSCGRGHLFDLDLPLGPEIPLLRQRWVEYGDNPLGRMYIAYVCDVVKPAIDARFRTLPSPEHTAAMGSSMGGLCAFLSAWRRPDVFAHAACLRSARRIGPLTICCASLVCAHKSGVRTRVCTVQSSSLR